MRQQLGRFDAASRDEDARFGADVPRIKQLIANNARRFNKPPRGPIGSLLRLRPEAVQHPDFNASKAAELLVSKVLRNFWCDNQEDNRTFRALLKSNNIEVPHTIVSRFRDNPYADLRVPPLSNDYVRAVDCFVFDPPDALNVVVDVTNIEGVVIVREANEGYKVAIDLLRHNVPNLHRVSLEDGSLRSRAGSGIKTMPAPFSSGLLLSKPTNQRKEVELQRKAAEVRLEALKQAQRTFERDARATDEAIARLEKELVCGCLMC